MGASNTPGRIMNYVKLGQERFSELVNKMGVDCVGTKMTKTELRIAELEADRDRLREALEGCLHVWTVNNLEAYVSGGKYIDDIVNRALSATGEHPDTVALRAVMEWLEEKEGAYPAGIFRPLTEEDTAKANAALQSAGVVHDRLSADISRLWCQQLREALDALKEAR